MSIVLARIDNRFVHGQILEGWIPYTRATYVLVASDAAAKNPIQSLAMETCATCGLEIKVLGVEDAVIRLMRGEFDKWRLILFFISPTLKWELQLSKVTIIYRISLSEEGCSVSWRIFFIVEIMKERRFGHLRRKGFPSIAR